MNSAALMGSLSARFIVISVAEGTVELSFTLAGSCDSAGLEQALNAACELASRMGQSVNAWRSELWWPTVVLACLRRGR